jgi:peptidyl-prolyl cis-trans isomerase C
MRTRALVAALGLVIAVVPFAAGGCKSCTSTSSDADAGGAKPVSSTLTPEQAAKVLAKVGERTITLGDYVAALEHMDQFDRLRYQSAERRKELLNEMINVMLLADEATAKGYDKDPITQQEIRAILRDAMLASARKGAPSPNDIPEADVKAYFDAHKSDYKDPERRRIALIVARDESAAKDALEAAKKSTSASQWGELVRAKSIDPQAKANVPLDLAGDFGMVSPPGDARGENPKVPEEVRAAAFEIAKIGEVLGHTVKSGSKMYVVRLTQKIEAHERSLPEAERTIRVKLAQDALRAREDELLLQLRKQFPVQVDEAALSAVRVDFMDAGVDGAPDGASGDAARE